MKKPNWIAGLPWPARSAGVSFMATGFISILLLWPSLVHAQQLYWSQFGTPAQIGRVNLDGTGRITSVQTGRQYGMETLDSTRQIYWIDNQASTIVRANADLSGKTTLVTNLGLGNVGMNEHLNLAIDEALNLIFWTNANLGTIGRASLSGGPILATFSSPGSFPDDLVVDPLNKKLYWTTQSGGVYRADYDGSNQSLLLSFGTTLGSGATGLDIDFSAGRLYAALGNSQQIVRANLDGTNEQTILSLPYRPFGMELFGGKMYWANLDGGALESANLDGTNRKLILSGLSDPRQVSIMAAVPEPSAIALACVASALFASTYLCRRGPPLSSQAR